MRDFIKDAWRIAAGCAAGAFVLSFLIGLIAGNPFGIAFSRAFLLALLFAALGAALRAVVKTWLPELGTSPAGASASSPGSPAGRPAGVAGSVDITVEDDEALRRQAYQGGADATSGMEGEESEPSEELEAADEESEVEGEARAVEELSEDLADELPSAPDAGARGRARQAAPAEDDGGAAEGDRAAEAPPTEDLLTEPAVEDLDALPDIADLESPAAPGRGAAARPLGRIPRPAVGETPEDAVRNLLGGQDPATLARAIRTSLKKDEKG